jgi:hypothetical protein
MEYGALQDPLEPERGLHLAVLVTGQPRRSPVEMLGQGVLEPGQVGAAGPQDLADLRGLENGQQQMLDREEFVASFTCLGEGIVQTKFELLR